jgi:hypothetical protein
MARRSPPRKVTYFEPDATAPRRQHHHRVHIRGQSPLPLHHARRLRPARSRSGDPADPGEWRPRMRAGRDAIYQLAAMTIGARLAVAD